jgi:hypothetical protein
MAGLYFEQFSVGQKFVHDIRRTVLDMDNMMFSALTYNPAAVHVDLAFFGFTSLKSLKADAEQRATKAISGVVEQLQNEFVALTQDARDVANNAKEVVLRTGKLVATSAYGSSPTSPAAMPNAMSLRGLFSRHMLFRLPYEALTHGRSRLAAEYRGRSDARYVARSVSKSSATASSCTDVPCLLIAAANRPSHNASTRPLSFSDPPNPRQAAS